MCQTRFYCFVFPKRCKYPEMSGVCLGCSLRIPNRLRTAAPSATCSPFQAVHIRIHIQTIIVNKDRADVPQERVWGNQVGLPTDFGISLNFLSQPTPHSSTTTPKMLYMHQKGKKRRISYREQGLLAGNKFDICHGSPWKMLSAGDYMTHCANNMHILPI